jgi:uncharacterized protein with HEPN domain
MKSPRNPRPYLRDILDSIERIRLYTKDLDLAGFLTDGLVQDAVIRRIEIMGEAWAVVRRDIPELEPQIRHVLDSL